MFLRDGFCQQRMAFSRQNHHAFGKQRFGCHVRRVIAGTQRAENKVHFAGSQFGCQRTESTFIGHHFDAVIPLRQADNRLRQ
ncbi:hypothetical protein D3C80_1686180 [compost metagenome]